MLPDAHNLWQRSGIPAEVEPVVRRYLSLVDAALPGSLQALYLVGSVALRDYQPGRSDIDFVAVTAGALTPALLARLAEVHATLQAKAPRPELAGIYVTPDDLRRNPLELAAVPFVRGGRLAPTGGFEANPAVWLTLRRYPCVVRGAAHPAVWHDPAVTRHWVLDNLRSYWAGLVPKLRRAALVSRLPLAPGLSGARRAQTIAWCTPGVTRLHYTLATGDITSKSGACRYALERFPPSRHALIAAALALHAGEMPAGGVPAALLAETADYLQWVIEDAPRSAGPDTAMSEA